MKKTPKWIRIIGYTIVVFSILNGILVVTKKTFLYKALWYNFANIDDYKLFSNRKVETGTPKKWLYSVNYNKKPLSNELEKLHKELETVAYVVIKNDSIYHEYYYDGYSDSSFSNSFSVAKSVVSLLVGCAIQDGLLKSIDQPIADFFPEMKKDARNRIQIKHLLMMSSGLNWDESYASPLSMTTEAYYGTNLPSLIEKLESVEEPGVNFSYKSGDSQLISMILEKVTGMNLSEYASIKLWKPLGAERAALWSLDHENGVEKAYCCMNSNAKDFARIGYLVLNNGKIDTTQIIPVEYLNWISTPNNLNNQESNTKVDFYGAHWWTIPNYKGHKYVYARGILGQYIIVSPDNKTIIVRLGKKKGKEVDNHYEEVFKMIDEITKTK